MKYYALEYANYTTLLLKTEAGLDDVLHALTNGRGLKAMSGTVYNPKAFQTLRYISTPDDRQKRCAQELSKVLIG